MSIIRISNGKFAEEWEVMIPEQENEKKPAWITPSKSTEAS